MGCGLCRSYCQIEHSNSRDIIKAFKKEAPRPLPQGTRGEERRGLFLRPMPALLRALVRLLLSDRSHAVGPGKRSGER